MNRPSPRGGRERVLLSVKRRRLTRDRRVLPLVLVGGTDVDPGVGVEGMVMSHWDEILEHWGIAMSAAGRSRGTIRTYMCHARKIRKLSPEGSESVTTDDLRRILANPKWTPETRKSVRTVFGTFFRWLHGEGYIEEDPALRLDIVSTPAGVARPAQLPSVCVGAGQQGRLPGRRSPQRVSTTPCRAGTCLWSCTT